MSSISLLFSPQSALLIFLLLLVYISYTIYQAFFGPLSKLPGPLIAKFTNFWRIKNAASGNAPANFQDLHRKYGTVVRTGPNHVSISDPAMIPSSFYDVFTPKNAGKSYPSIFTLQSQDAHRQLKAGIAQKYSLSSLLSLEPMVDNVTRNFMSTLHERASSGTRLDLGEWVQFYAFDVIGAITFTGTFGFIDKGCDERGILRGLDGGLIYGAVVGQVPGWHEWLMGSSFLQETVMKIPVLAAGNPVPIVVQMIKDALASNAKDGAESTREDFITFMRKQNEKDPERMSEDVMINHMFVNLLAGSDTTAISLRSIFYLLMKNPCVYAKLQAEIDAADSKGLLSPIITYSEGQEHVPYLANVIKESLRLHPAVALPLERIVPTSSPLQTQSHTIPAGAVVGINAWVVHYDKNVFGQDARVFRPERWSEENGERLKMMERSFFAFGHGSRSCVGKNISLMEMGKFVPQFLREFEISWDGDEDGWKVDNTWFAKQSGVFVRYRSRERKAVFA
ncbi:putative cytochrome P450 pisatin demethylase [Mollisia scopiformis]|uniref:Putative cytochrome P450 pisatin demethylase n=1 Tax=Mollisia scopiformis TaxID=149040 RepID=A0A194XMV2_MOLSC|nr:putative cytochrome P450 pisatin demethylase [Mollisia scopiformis]KUJ21456.1 putative cytochrome P450 pisatin demethylase [Mollisia scopiformis]